MPRLLSIIVGVVLLSLVRVSADDQWPQFRGPQAGVAADDPACPTRGAKPRTSSGRVDVPGLGWSSPVVWDDHVFITSADQRRQGSARRSRASTIRATITARRQVDVREPLDGVRHRLQDRQDPLVARAAAAAMPPIAPAHQEQLRVGDGGHRRRARLRVLRQHRPGGRARHERQDRLDEGARRLQRPLASSARPPRRSLHKDRLYVVNDNTTQSFIAAFDTRTGREIWRIKRDEEGAELGHAVRLGERAAHRDRDDGQQQGALLRSRRQAALGADGHDHPDACRRPFATHGLLYISSGYPGQRAASGLRDPARRDRATSRSSRTRRATSYVAWYQPLLGTYNTSALVLRRLLLHAARPRLPALPRREDRQADLRPAAHLAPRRAASRRRRGRTTARSSC